ncbi:DnaJ homolog subfamily C member 9 [Entomortierella parvispora]|uniref:DnaJ homolog subfamily C member 9 n=1 Tax=Entomortierella parvispora TaxID=205924 RepID=A0A9P3LU84_9FUNG|nr:DnaJ homolog subfamily C member 9 [Entomortierella parvispora]
MVLPWCSFGVFILAEGSFWNSRRGEQLAMGIRIMLSKPPFLVLFFAVLLYTPFPCQHSASLRPALKIPFQQQTVNMPKVTSFALYDPEVSLYTVLNVNNDADQAAIKKAYYKLALAFHPDKQSPTSTDSERDQATAKFQRLGFAYAVLGDQQRRKVYDQTGDVSEDGIAGFGAQGQAAGGWDAYFRELWTGIVSEATIREFERTYRFSDEEKRDVIHAYVTYRGDMDGILSAVPVCTYADEGRFREMIQSAIDAKVARKYKAFGGPVVDPKAAARRKREAEAEAIEAEKLWKELGLERLKKQSSTKRKLNSTEPEEVVEPGSERELQLMMMQNGKQRQGAMDALLERYSTKKPKKERKKKNAKEDESGPSVSSSSNQQNQNHQQQQQQQQYQQQQQHQQQQQQQQQRYGYKPPSEEEFLATQARLLGRNPAATAASVGIHPSLTTNNPAHLYHATNSMNTAMGHNNAYGASSQRQQQHHMQQQQQMHQQQQQQHNQQQQQQQQQHTMIGGGSGSRGRMAGNR